VKDMALDKKKTSGKQRSCWGSRNPLGIGLLLEQKGEEREPLAGRVPVMGGFEKKPAQVQHDSPRKGVLIYAKKEHVKIDKKKSIKTRWRAHHSKAT